MPEQNGTERPFIETPDEQELQATDLMCFFNPERVCGGDCMSYTTQKAEAKILSAQQKHCVILVALERMGRHSGMAIKAVRELRDEIVKAAMSPPKAG